MKQFFTKTFALLKKCIVAVLDGYHRLSAYVAQKPLRSVLYVSLVLNLLIEVLARRSLIDGLSFVLLRPYIFLFNTVLLYVTLALSLLFARRAFALSIITVVWVALGITNCVLLGMRNTPLSAIDFGLLFSCFDIIPVYLSFLEIALIVLAFAAVGFILSQFFGKTYVLRPPKFSRLRSLLTYVLLLAVAAALILISVVIGAVPTTFADITVAYDDYGFVYCFSLSVIDRGVDRPDDYSGDKIGEIMSGIDKKNETDTDKQPNVIFVQLESFFDVNRLKNITFSQNPIPVFTSLKETHSSGLVTVPTIGAGTANTEFEVLTGMNLDDFGAGEYPYKTVLQEKTTESIPFNLRELGYVSHAIHNNTATFYDRDEVYSSLGFDTYTSLEYMEDVVYNPLGWAKDTVLTDEILTCLDATPTSDFVFAVSVQPHGRYPDEEADTEKEDAYESPSILDKFLYGDDASADSTGGTEEAPSSSQNVNVIEVYGIEDESLSAQYSYYVNQLYEVDAFIGALVTALSDYDEDTVVVFYGDHFPCFNYTEEDLGDGSTPYDTDYVIWSNFEMEKHDATLPAYRLSATVFDYLDIHEGILTRLHQTHAEDADYLASLKLLEYDMLYGNMEAWGGISPYLPTVVRMGIHEIVVTGTSTLGSSLYISGAHFTPYSHVKINNSLLKTVYIDSETLLVPDVKLRRDSFLSVIQSGTDGKVLSESNRIVVTATKSDE